MTVISAGASFPAGTVVITCAKTGRRTGMSDGRSRICAGGLAAAAATLPGWPGY
jgi:hypothetical protein